MLSSLLIHPQSVAISQCGTFAFVGSDGGSLVMYNLQSGLRRQSFPPRVTPAQVKKARLQRLVDAKSNQLDTKAPTKHTKAITGIVVDSLNTTVVSCGLDGKVKVCIVFPEHYLNITCIDLTSFGTYLLVSFWTNWTGIQCVPLLASASAAPVTF